MGQISVLTGPERWRRWSEDERHRIVAEAFAPGSCVAQVARDHDISTGLIYTWQRRFADAAGSLHIQTVGRGRALRGVAKPGIEAGHVETQKMASLSRDRRCMNSFIELLFKPQRSATQSSHDALGPFYIFQPSLNGRTP